MWGRSVLTTVRGERAEWVAAKQKQRSDAGPVGAACRVDALDLCGHRATRTVVIGHQSAPLEFCGHRATRNVVSGHQSAGDHRAAALIVIALFAFSPQPHRPVEQERPFSSDRLPKNCVSP